MAVSGPQRDRSDKSQIKKTIAPAWFIVAAFMIALSGCEKKIGDAVVLAKEHIDARLPDAETPSSSGEQRNARPTGTKTEPEATPDVQIQEMSDDEIAVDGYVMKADDRGTSRDPRASQHEQWIVKVQMLDDGRRFRVQADQSQWEKLRENDRVKVRYRIGKYTGTVWAAEIE